MAAFKIGSHEDFRQVILELFPPNENLGILHAVIFSGLMHAANVMVDENEMPDEKIFQGLGVLLGIAKACNEHLPELYKIRDTVLNTSIKIQHYTLH